MDHTVVKERSCQEAKFKMIKLHNQYLKTRFPTIIFYCTWKCWFLWIKFSQSLIFIINIFLDLPVLHKNEVVAS